MKMNKLTGFALATAAAGMFAVTAAGPVSAQAAAEDSEREAAWAAAMNIAA